MLQQRRGLIRKTPWLALCLIAASSPCAESIPQGRLPDAATPIAYRLDLIIDPDQERFSGHAEIDIVLGSATRSLYLHGRDLHMTSATAVSASQRMAASYQQLDELGTARIQFPHEMPAGPATLIFDYDASFGDSPAGLHRIKIGGDWYAWTQFESIDARAAFPSFDEPGFKTPFSVSLTTRPGFLALSNMPESGAPEVSGTLVRHRFLPTPPLPTYLVAFVAGPFITAAGAVPATALRAKPLPLRIVATRNQAGKLDYALHETMRIVELLENYFGQQFPFPKLDQIASPVLGGAMENAGADVYADNILLLDQGASTVQKQNFGMVVAHELSHQWFGDYVTPVWWDDIWLNESFANWMGYRIGDQWRPELNIGVNAIGEALAAMNTDSLAAGRPIRQPILTNGEIDSAFDAITYGKGGQIIAMIARYLGDAKFRDGVRLYMQRRPYGSATSNDFFTALADAAGDARILTALRSFVDQQGVPVVDLQPVGAGYRARQSRYLRLGSEAPDQTWVIPFCVRRGADSTCALLDSKTQDLAVKGTGPLVPNEGGTGYYRYFLTAADWDALLTQAATLPAGEALAASDSLWAQFTGATLPAASLLKAVRMFVDNGDSNVALYGGQKLAGMQRRGLIGPAAQADYRKLMNVLYGRKLAGMGFDLKAGAQAGDSPDRQKLRQELVDLVAEEAGDASTRRRLDVAARAWLGGDSGALDQAYYAQAMLAHVQEGDLATTRILYERMLAAKDELFREAALRALGGSGRKRDAQWLIDQFKDTRLRSTDRLYFMSALMAEERTRDVAFEWLKAHYEEFAKGVGSFDAAVIPQLPRDYCEVSKAQEIEQALLSKVVAAGRGELAFRRMLEGIRTCGVLKQAKSAEIVAALKQAAATF